MKSIISEIAITLLIASVLFLGIHYTVQNSEVISGSMQPTLGIGERLFVNKLAYKFGHAPQRGDIIVFIPPASLNSDKDYIKRIIGLPGEVVEVKSGTVYIHKQDGSVIQLEELYVTTPANKDYISGTIPAGQYFVMGDNRNNSNDSRYWGTVPRSAIVGRAWWIIWPFSKFGSAPNYKLPQ
jgi:signal peptidase I